MTGTVFDIGYRNYTGVREGRARGRAAVYKDGLRAGLGLGRGPRAKVLPWLFIAVLSGIALIMALVIGAAERLGGPGAAAQNDLPSHSDYNGIASVIVFVFAAVVGPELLCRDKRDRVINLYLVRPITGSDYIVSRWAALMTIMTVALVVPQVILFLGNCGGALKPADYFQEHWIDIPNFLLAAVALAAYTTTLALLTASFTSRRAYASVFLVGLFVITTPFTVGLASEVPGMAGQWISMFNLTGILVHVNDIIFGELSEMTDNTPARKFARWIRIAWYLGWTLIPAAILWFRYRKLTP